MTMSHRRLLFSGIGGCLLAGALLAATLSTNQTIQIQIDGQPRTVSTRADTVAGVLQSAGIWLDPADAVVPPLDSPLDPETPILVTRAPLFSVQANGQTRLLRTRVSAPESILAGIGLSLGPGDELLVDGGWPASTLAASGALPRHLELLRAVDLTVEEAGAEPRAVRAAARTVGDALWELGYRLYQEDEVSPPLDTPLTPALTISLRRSQPILVQADGQTLLARTLHGTVGAALRQVGVALVGEDYSLPAGDQPLPDSGLISVVRVREEIITEQQLIPYETVYQALADVEIDNVYQVQTGVPGVLRTLTRVRYENGVEVSRVSDGETLAQQPVNQVIGYGTQIVIRTLDTPDGPIEYWRSYTMYATSYAAKFTGRTPGTFSYGRTASGKYVTKGIVAIDRGLIPFGTRMYVPGYGFAEAADTGGGVRGRFIDLGYDDFNYVGWSRVVTVYFLTPAPPAGSIRYIIPSTVP